MVRFIDKMIDVYKEREQGIDELLNGIEKIIRPPKAVKQPDVDYLVIKDTASAKREGILGHLSKEVVVHSNHDDIPRVFPFSNMVVSYLNASDDLEIVDMSSNIHDLFSFDRAVLLQRFPYPRRGL